MAGTAVCMMLADAAPAAAAPDIAAQIAAREAACNAAYAANDLKTYFGCYAEDMTGLFPDGRTTLAEYRDSWTKMIKAGGHVDQFDYADLKIQVAPGGAAAVASYHAQVKVTQPNGKLSDHGLFYETDVWFRGKGGWKIAETHYSKGDPAK